MKKHAVITLGIERGTVLMDDNSTWDLPYAGKTKTQMLAVLVGLSWEVNGVTSFEIIDETKTIH